jgi:uncharacterized protein (TIGR02391 family)
MRPLPFTDEQIVSMPIDRLALTILKALARRGNEFWSWYNWTNDWRNAGVHAEPVVHAFGEAWGWLYSNGLVADDALNTKQFVTRLGHETIKRGPEYLSAVRMASVDIHPRIAAIVREQFLLGRYELAAFAALREVEIRVRELAAARKEAVGVTLMRNAFNPSTGSLRDPSSEGGEQQGLSDLFAGAIATFKNPTSHREVTFENPTQAAEVIAFASLLHRILDGRPVPTDLTSRRTIVGDSVEPEQL